MFSSSAIARAAIASMIAMALPNDAGATAASCHQAARHLVTLIKNSWPSSDQSNPDPTGDMIGLVTRKSPAGVVVGTTRFELTYSRQEFTARAGRLKPPFTPSSELLKALDDLNEEMVVVALPVHEHTRGQQHRRNRALQFDGVFFDRQPAFTPGAGPAEPQRRR
jgi:hypothetical protein